MGTQLQPLLVFNLVLKITTLKEKQEELFNIHLCRDLTAASFVFQLGPENICIKKTGKLLNFALCRSSTASSSDFQLDPENICIKKRKNC